MKKTTGETTRLLVALIDTHLELNEKRDWKHYNWGNYSEDYMDGYKFGASHEVRMALHKLRKQLTGE